MSTHDVIGHVAREFTTKSVMVPTDWVSETSYANVGLAGADATADKLVLHGFSL